ncbi:hypothetical protein K457DRAFT_120228 [Linnemannia elongata AG-77]|uniref:Uncharacterized protein n=1 Tax=Linnemannia elongata AG-77 TaxID=1314771 RepID=A0A197KID3_9FUNG|nr:hypothetical protein K457DRAFT_120228 [Linnemannia elongata AG-77]
MIEPHSSSLCMHSMQNTIARQHPDQVRIASHPVVSHSSHHQLSVPLIVPEFFLFYSSPVVITIADIATISDGGVCFSSQRQPNSHSLIPYCLPVDNAVQRSPSHKGGREQKLIQPTIISIIVVIASQHIPAFSVTAFWVLPLEMMMGH